MVDPLPVPSQPIKTPSSSLYEGKSAPLCHPLEPHFRKWGFNFRQITREGNIAIFEQTWKNGDSWFEVVIIRAHKGYTVSGCYVEPSEYYPSSCEWGTMGWTYQDKDEAFAKFQKLKSPEESTSPEL